MKNLYKKSFLRKRFYMKKYLEYIMKNIFMFFFILYMKNHLENTYISWKYLKIFACGGLFVYADSNIRADEGGFSFCVPLPTTNRGGRGETKLFFN